MKKTRTTTMENNRTYYELKDGQGSFFVNDKTRDNGPTHVGKIMLNGKLYRIAGWQRTNKSGGQWWSLSIREWEDREQNNTGALIRAAQQVQGHNDLYAQNMGVRPVPVSAPCDSDFEEKEDDLSF